MSFRECIALRHNWFSRQRCALDTLTDSISDKPSFRLRDFFHRVMESRPNEKAKSVRKQDVLTSF